MTAILLTSIFGLACAVAAWTIISTLCSYGPSALALRGSLKRCENGDWITVQITEVVVAGRGNVLRPDFSPAATPRPPHPREMRAAA